MRSDQLIQLELGRKTVEANVLKMMKVVLVIDCSGATRSAGRSYNVNRRLDMLQ